MQKLIYFLQRYGIFALSLGIPALATAQLVGPPPGATPAPTISLTTTSVGTSLCNAINWLFYGLIILTVIFVLIAAYRYLTAAGDPERVSSANKTILYAVIAVVVAVLAKGIPIFASSLIGGPSLSACSGGGGQILGQPG